MKQRFEFWILAVGTSLLASMVLADSEAEDHWPLVRHDLHSSGVANSSLSSSVGLQWKYVAEDAGFEATAVVSDGIIYIGDTDTAFHAIRLTDGKSIWKHSFEMAGFASAAAVQNGQIYVSDYDGLLWCLSTEDGHTLWSVELEAESYVGPIIYKESVLLTNDAGILTSLSIHDGQREWKYEIDAPLRCAPTIAAGQALLAGCDGKLHIVDANTGVLSATLPIDGPTGSTPAAHQDRAFFGTEQGTFYAIVLGTASETEPHIDWTYHDPQRRQSLRTAAAVDNRLVVYGSQGKSIYALEPSSGKLQWKVAVKSRVDSSPTITGDQVVCATVKGRIYLLDIETGATMWEYDAGGGFVGSPVVVAGQLILGNTDGTLYCFGSLSQENH
jgi:outer membrane protein assembly factor BamB